MKRRWLFTAFLLAVSAPIAGPAVAQFEHLTPENWFPLDLGSYWHYSYVTENPVLVEIQKGTAGSAADSTDLELTVFANDIHFEGHFVYKIGRVQDLVGAVVNGLSYGDTSLIRGIALSAEDQPAGEGQRGAYLAIYPNPALGPVTVRVVAGGQGRYALVVYNVLGQRVYHAEQWLSDGQEWRYAVSGGAVLPGGVYVVQVRRNDLPLLAKTMIVLR